MLVGDSSGLKGGITGLFGSCTCCGNEDCTCAHTCVSDCAAWVCARCAPCAFSAVISGASATCDGTRDAASQSASACVVWRSACFYTYSDEASKEGKVHAGTNCSGIVTKTYGLNIVATFGTTGTDPSDRASITIQAWYGNFRTGGASLVFDAVYTHTSNAFDWSDFPLTISNRTGLASDSTSTAHGGSITLDVDCCDECFGVLTCPTCDGCCSRLLPTFASGGNPGVFGSVPLLVKESIGTCDYQGTVNWSAGCSDGKWFLQFWDISGGTGKIIRWEAFAGGEGCLDLASGWRKVRDDYGDSPNLVSLDCVGACADPITNTCCSIYDFFLSSGHDMGFLNPKDSSPHIDTWGIETQDDFGTGSLVCSGGVYTLTLDFRTALANPASDVVVFTATADASGCPPTDPASWTRTSGTSSTLTSVDASGCPGGGSAPESFFFFGD